MHRELPGNIDYTGHRCSQDIGSRRDTARRPGHAYQAVSADAATRAANASATG